MVPKSMVGCATVLVPVLSWWCERGERETVKRVRTAHSVRVLSAGRAGWTECEHCCVSGVLLHSVVKTDCLHWLRCVRPRGKGLLARSNDDI